MSFLFYTYFYNSNDVRKEDGGICEKKISLTDIWEKKN